VLVEEEFIVRNTAADRAPFPRTESRAIAFNEEQVGRTIHRMYMSPNVVIDYYSKNGSLSSVRKQNDDRVEISSDHPIVVNNGV